VLNITGEDEDEVFGADCAAARIGGFRDVDSNQPMDTSLAEANVSRAHLEQVYASGTSFWRADLTGTKIWNSYFEKTTFQEATLVGTIFSLSRMAKVTLADARLAGASFRVTFAADLNLDGADVSGLTLSGSRVVVSRVHALKAEPRTDEQVAAMLVGSDSAPETEALWRAQISKALREGKNPFSAAGDAKFVCGLNRAKSAEPLSCEPDSDENLEAVTRSLLKLACADKDLVPPSNVWRPFGVTDTLTTRVRQAILNEALANIFVVEDFEDPKPLPRWSIGVSGYVLSRCSKDVQSWISADQLAALRAEKFRPFLGDNTVWLERLLAWATMQARTWESASRISSKKHKR
jgi:uncharacterized protein YjbI with pentapeptide repeats